MDEIKIPWDGWVFGRKLGQGSFGAVYEIQREITGGTEKSALKIIRFPQSEDEVEDLQDSGMDDQSIRARFVDQANGIKKEYGIMARLKGCTNVVYCDDLYEETGADGFSRTLFIKMELLKPLIKTIRTSYDPEEVARAAGTDICKALSACEKNNIVHRDIKPQNIFVTEDGVYKLGDFGIARTMEKTMNGTKTGTFNFMAPEVYRGENYGKRVDIYSLGIMLYWLLNEKRGPFLPLPPENVTISNEEEARRKRFSGEPLPPPKNGSDALKAIVLKACAFKPEDRFQNAGEMLSALSGISGIPQPHFPEADRSGTAQPPENKALRSIIDDPQSVEVTDPIICGMDIVSGGVCILDRNISGDTPLGMTFSELLDLTCGESIPGYMGIRSADQLLSGAFLQDNGGIGRVIFMPSALKQQVQKTWDAMALRQYGVRDFTSLILDEYSLPFGCPGFSNWDYTSFLYRFGHPVNGLESIFTDDHGNDPGSGRTGDSGERSVTIREETDTEATVGMFGDRSKKDHRYTTDLSPDDFSPDDAFGDLTIGVHMRNFTDSPKGTRQDPHTNIRNIDTAEEGTIRNITRNPQTIHSTDPIVCYVDSIGVFISDEAHFQKAPSVQSAYTFSEFKDDIMATTQHPIAKYMGIRNIDQLLSDEFLIDDGGIGRVIWMPSNIRQMVQEKWNAVALQQYGVKDFCSMIGDERLYHPYEYVEIEDFLNGKLHPAMEMAPLEIKYY